MREPPVETDAMALSSELRSIPSARPPAAESFEIQFTALAGMAYGVALRLSRHRADAEDLVQESALLAFRAFHTFETGTNFKAWFLKILMHEHFRRRRTIKRRPTAVDFDDVPDLYIYGHMIEAGLPTTGADPATTLLDRMDSEQVGRAVEELPDEYRAVATLYFMQDLSYQEIAEVLSVPVGTVRSRLHRGRKMLQKSLWHLAEESGIVRNLTRGDADT